MRPRIRTIKPEFYGDEKVCAVSEGARFTTIGLISYADDRGRGQLQLSAIKGFIYPAGDVNDRRLSHRLEEIFAQGIAKEYEIGSCSYLWLPNFWRHQIINKPTESVLPAHPEDPFADLPIREALEEFRENSRSNPVGLRENSRSNPVGLPPSRVGARSVPFLSLPFSSTTNDQGEPNSARKSRRADQDQLPASLADDLHAVAREVLPILEAVQAERGGNTPSLRGVGLAIAHYPDRDHLTVLRELEHWALAGTGQAKTVKDWARTYGTFLERAPAGSPSRNGTGVSQGHVKASVIKRNALMEHD